ncbi:MAG: gliding motility-associated C-terminal domain-containing protein [Chitinophagales bacterium]|nr:gliding motility-associated C-terminal domain-containing protein [Chitinophagales bacterium]
MRFLIILLTCLAAVFQYPSDLQAQCNTTPCTVPVPAINAQDACILPSQQSLNCYYGGTTPDLPQSIPSVWCTDIDNNHWFAFTATSNFVLFNFTAFGCTSGTGIQVGILSTTDCVNFQTIASCTAVLPGTPVPLITSQLVPGQVYYLCIDGIAGALCEYAINGSDPSINVVGSPNICIPTDPMVTYSTPWGASSWTINPPGAGTILGNPVGNVITVEWTQPGPAQVCAQNVACPGAPQKCMNVLVRGGVTEEHVNLCEGGTVTCAGQVYNAPGIYEVQFNNGSGCDSIVNCFVHLSPRDTSKIKVSLCGPASWTLCDTVVTTSGQYSRICTNTAGCDSVILLDLAIMLPNANIAPPDTLGCGADTVITLNGSGSNLNLAAGGITRYLWTGPGIVGPDTLASVKVKLPGVYCLVLTHGRDSVFCRDTACVTVIQETGAPQTPVLSGNLTPCAGTSEWYVATGAAPASYEWTSTGGISLFPVSQDSILVVWPDTGISGQICLLARDSCGASAPVCWSFQVSALQHPQTAQICAGNTIFLGGAFQTSPGVYIDTLTSVQGCDSILVTTLTVLSVDTVEIQQFTCDPAQAGVFTQTFSNQFGCDSVVISSITLQPTDTTQIQGFTCDPAQAGVFTQQLSNQFGCDSVVISSITLQPTDTTQIQGFTCDPAQAGVFTQQLSNQFGCDSVVISTITLQPTDTTQIQGFTCDPAQAGVFTQQLSNQFGCDSLVISSITLQPSDTTQIQGFTCDPAQAGVFAQQLSNQFGCDSVVITQLTLTLPTIAVQAISDYNGFGVSCAGNTDGSLALSITGTGSVAVEWSNGATTHALNNLSAGNYAVTVTDLNGGCTAIGSWQLEAPDTLQFSFAVNNLTCFGQENGAIQVNVQGGTEPYLFALNQQGFQPGNTFSNLDAGTYQITTMDANGCEQTEIILVNAALPVTVDLGDDLTIELGDSIELQAIVNIPLDSILSVAWTPPSNDPECMNCLEQIVAPFVSTSYAVEVTALNGCTGRDQVNILVNRSKYVFIPNVFSPNEDGENDWLSVFSRPGMVKEIKSFRVFDRWGNQLYGLEKFQPNNNQSGWDGTYKGQPMNPGVFVWVAEVTFVDGITETFTGNVTLVR